MSLVQTHALTGSASPGRALARIEFMISALIKNAIFLRLLRRLKIAQA